MTTQLKCQRCENGSMIYELTDKVLGDVHKCVNCGGRHYEHDTLKPLAKSSKTQSKKYNFIQYEKYGYARKPAISIWSGNRIHINRAMLTKFKLLNAKRVLLFFDDDNKAIGIRFTDEKRKDAFALTGHTNGRMVHAQSFFKHCGLKITRSKKYSPNFSRELGLFVVDLLRTNEGKCPKCKRMLASNGPFCGGNTCVHPKCNKSKSRNDES